MDFGTDVHTFSFKSASLTGRETVLGGGGETDVSAILDKDRGEATIVVSHQHQLRLGNEEILNGKTYHSRIYG